MRKDDELACVMIDPDVVRRLDQDFDQGLAGTERISPSSLQPCGTLTRAGERLVHREASASDREIP